MRAEHINPISRTGMVALSLVALLAVLTGVFFALFGSSNPFRESDEGTGAHIFQLAIAGFIPTTLVFLATEDWTRPVRIVRRMTVPVAALVLAFGLLYYFEHYR